MRRVRRLLPLVSVIVIVLFALAVPARMPAGPTSEDTEPASVRPIHGDAQALEQAALEVTRALLRDDAAAARRALDRIDEISRRLDRERDAAYGSEIVTHEQSFRLTLNRARELAGKGELEDAFNQYVWVQRACIGCHGLARDRGLYPPAARVGSGGS